MINLIPNHEKKRKIKDFYFRLAAASLFTLGFCVLAGIVSLLPAYFHSSVQGKLLDAELSSLAATEEDQTLSQAAGELDRKLRMLEQAQKNKYIVTHKVINEITVRKMPDIKITRISYENKGTEGKKVEIFGSAPSRERLLQFRRALEDDVAFKKVDLPISNFVKGANIRFSLTLIPS